MERLYRTRPRKPLLTERIRTWQAAMDRLDTGEGSPDHDASNAERPEIAFLGHGSYVECRPLRDFSIRDGEAADLRVPALPTGRSR
jgi:hypothetical protein